VWARQSGQQAEERIFTELPYALRLEVRVNSTSSILLLRHGPEPSPEMLAHAAPRRGRQSHSMQSGVCRATSTRC